MHKSEVLTLGETNAALTLSAAKPTEGVNPKCTGAANSKCIGVMGKETPPCQRGKETGWRGDFFDPGGIKP